MGDEWATVDASRTSDPGTSDAPRTQYKSSGHKIPGQGERIRRRTQEMVNGDTGPVVFHQTEHNLQVAVEHPDLSDVDAYHAARAISHGIAVGAACRAAEPYAGYLSTGEDTSARLRGPQDQIRHLFGVS
jgi:hypothetical protein